MTLSNLKWLLAALLAAPSAFGMPMGRETGNGGDPVAIDFVTQAVSAIRYVTTHANEFPEIKDVDLIATLNSAKILVSEEPLMVQSGDFAQSSTARNFVNPSRVEIYRTGWLETKDERLRQATALHEVLSLAGLEATGVYKIVGRYKPDESVPASLNTHICMASCNFWWHHGVGAERVLVATEGHGASFAEAAMNMKADCDTKARLKNSPEGGFLTTEGSIFNDNKTSFEIGKACL